MVKVPEEPLDRLPDEDVSHVMVTGVPVWRSATGYGSRIPTQYMVRVGSRIFRVYAICYSNVASHYVRRGGVRQFLTVFTLHRLEDARDAHNQTLRNAASTK